MIFKEFLYCENDKVNYYINAVSEDNYLYFFSIHKDRPSNRKKWNDSFFKEGNLKNYITRNKSRNILLASNLNFEIEDKIINLMFSKDLESKQLGFTMIQKELNKKINKNAKK